DALCREHIQESRSGEHPSTRPTVRRPEVDGNGRHGLADVDDADCVEVAGRRRLNRVRLHANALPWSEVGIDGGVRAPGASTAATFVVTSSARECFHLHVARRGAMASRAPFLTTRFGAYYHRDVFQEDTELTHTGAGTPCGEYLRRFWQPICFTDELRDLPVRVKILGEE